MTQITLTEKRYVKNPNTKTTYILETTETTNVTEKQHSLTTNNDTCKWFRRLGGSETKQMEYTCAGYKCTKLTSVSPDKQNKIVREYSFKWIEANN
jgi:hypothetical protein